MPAKDCERKKPFENNWCLSSVYIRVRCVIPPTEVGSEAVCFKTHTNLNSPKMFEEKCGHPFLFTGTYLLPK